MLYFVYQPMPFGDLARMAAIGMLGMGGQLLMIRAYRSAPAAQVAPFQYSQFLWAMLYSYLWFDEVPSASVLGGAAIIVLAGLLIVWRESSRGVSINRPFLRTRNVKAAAAPPMRPTESDVDDLVDAGAPAEEPGIVHRRRGVRAPDPD